MREVWDARHLMYELARADLVRHTSRLRLGILWWFLDPLVLALIYWGLVDQLLGRGESIHPRYWLFLFLGLISGSSSAVLVWMLGCTTEDRG